MPEPSRSSARLLAPIALVLFAFAFFAVLASSGSDDGDSGNASQSSERTTTTKPRTSTQPSRPRRASYSVKVGDTLGSISEKTGVPVEVLQELNPQLDPQALVSGQKIKLRE